MPNSRPIGVLVEVMAGERVRVLLVAWPHEIRANRCVRVEQQTLGVGAQHVAVGCVRLGRVAHWHEELLAEEALDSLSRVHQKPTSRSSFLGVQHHYNHVVLLCGHMAFRPADVCEGYAVPNVVLRELRRRRRTDLLGGERRGQHARHRILVESVGARQRGLVAAPTSRRLVRASRATRHSPRQLCRTSTPTRLPLAEQSRNRARLEPGRIAHFLRTLLPRSRRWRRGRLANWRLPASSVVTPEGRGRCITNSEYSI